jgi:DNA-binding MarR family transcriptional regulator
MPTGEEQLVLATYAEMAGQGYEYVLASDIALKSGMGPGAVQDCLRGLDREGFVDLASLENGDLRFSVTPKGRRELAKDAFWSEDIMERLTGHEKLVLQAVLNLPKDQFGTVRDAEIASDVGLSLPQVKDSLEGLHLKGLVTRIRLVDGHLAALSTAKGSRALSQYRPFGTSSYPGSPPGSSPASHSSPTVQPPTNQPSPTSETSPTSPTIGPGHGGTPTGSTTPAPVASQTIKPVRLFYSYARKDEPLRDELAWITKEAEPANKSA